MAAVLEVLSLGLGLADLIKTGVDANKAPVSNANTNVRIGAGLSDDRKQSFSGAVPGVIMYDIMGRRVGGTTTKGTIADGAFQDITVPYDKGVGSQASEYIQVVNGGKEAVCICYITVTMPSGGAPKPWFAGIGQQCQAPWYYSNDRISDTTAAVCVWIDGDHTNGFPQGMGIHLTDFQATDKRADQFNKDNDLLCNVAPRFRMYDNIDMKDVIPFLDKNKAPLNLDDGTDKDPAATKDSKNWIFKDSKNFKMADLTVPHKKYQKRGEKSRKAQEKVGGGLIISKHKGHSAKALCNSHSSHGHDFVSQHEGLYCDMSAKQLYPVCDGKAAGKGGKDAKLTKASGKGASAHPSAKKTAAAKGSSKAKAEAAKPTTHPIEKPAPAKDHQKRREPGRPQNMKDLMREAATKTFAPKPSVNAQNEPGVLDRKLPVPTPKVQPRAAASKHPAAPKQSAANQPASGGLAGKELAGKQPAAKDGACFDLKTQKLRAGNAIRGRDVNTGKSVPAKEFKKVLKWD